MDPRLEALRARYQESVGKEITEANSQLPLINEGTFHALVSEFDLPVDPIAHRVSLSISGETGVHPIYTAMKRAEQVFKTFNSGSERGGFLMQVDSWLRSNYSNSPVHIKNFASLGLAFVLRAFHLQEGGTFVDALKEMPDVQIMKAFQDTTRDLSGESNMVKRIMSGKEIPSYQFYLNDALNFLAFISPVEESVEEGALAMYSALEKLWPAIKDPSKRQSPKLY